MWLIHPRASQSRRQKRGGRDSSNTENVRPMRKCRFSPISLSNGHHVNSRQTPSLDCFLSRSTRKQHLGHSQKGLPVRSTNGVDLLRQHRWNGNRSIQSVKTQSRKTTFISYIFLVPGPLQVIMETQTVYNMASGFSLLAG